MIVGQPLQKTCCGLAFYSEASFLSNFYKCPITYRVETYICLEQAYQARKAIVCGNNEALRTIMVTESQVLMKITGQKINLNRQWEDRKLQLM